MQLTPDEPLAESAPLAWRAAAEHCWRDPRTGERCDWFHGTWQILRLLGLNTTPEHHQRFFEDALSPLAKPGRRPAVLISGTADYSLLARLLFFFRNSGAEPLWTVADRCETPLILNRWYAGRAGCEISTRCCDILELEGEAAYDVICTHSLIGQLLPGHRDRLAKTWHRLLRPGGRLVTVNRLRPAAGAEWVGFSEAQGRTLAQAVKDRLPSILPLLDAAPSAVESLVARYASRMGAWPVHSQEELRALFETAGLAIEHLSAEAVDSRGTGVSGPTALHGAVYALLAARRP